jgi:hypothetical protein
MTQIPVAKYLGIFLLEAEKIAGPRDMTWTVLGCEFVSDDDPHTWFPHNCDRHVVIRLTRTAERNHGRALYQLAHETIHVLSPRGPSNRAPNLEEGVACVFAIEMVTKYVKNIGVNYDPGPLPEDRREAHDDVTKLLAINPVAIRVLRAIEPQFSKITPDLIKHIAPGIDDELAQRLCRPWVKK